MTSDGAEPAGVSTSVIKSAIAAHRDAPNRDASLERVEAADDIRNRLLENHRPPRTITPIVVVAVAAAVEEDNDWCARPELRKRFEESVRQHRVRPRRLRARATTAG